MCAKAHAGHDPNARDYSRKVERIVRRMRSEEFDELLNGVEAKTDTTGGSWWSSSRAEACDP
ncbi:MAG: hypothetical protein ABI651_11530 [Verrucomicrobiota bacterium]